MVFDKSKLKTKSLKERVHDLDLTAIKSLENKEYHNKDFREVALRVVEAKRKKKKIIVMLGAHVIRAGVQRYLIDLIKRDYISCIAINGGGMIHDFEFALIGATTESVARYIKEGQFGLWKETGEINDIINRAYRQGEIGMGEAIGRAIHEGNYPHKDISILAACYRLNIPGTVHIGIGYDIIHEHPNFDGAAAGATSYLDFLRFVEVVSGLEGGVLLNFGSAVMAPEVFLKALSMVRNVANQEGRDVDQFTTLVCDLHDLPDDFSKEPSKESPAYYFRPWKTMLVRTVTGGGGSFYIKGKHSETIPALWTAINEEENP
jgi:hypothetical protein